jgi:hypothetical protein
MLMSAFMVAIAVAGGILLAGVAKKYIGNTSDTEETL